MLFPILLAGLCAHLSTAEPRVAPGEYDPMYGTYVGKFTTLWHDVVGEVYAVDNITIHIRGFSYDGEAPDAYFFAGNNSPKPTNKGFIIPNEKNKKEVLGPYRNKNLVLRFPITKKGQRGFFDIKWLSVWCEQLAIDFGHVVLPENMETPSPMVTSGLASDSSADGYPQLKSSSVRMMDSNTIVVDDLSFDGSVDDAIFVAGSGNENAAGFQLATNKGGMNPLRKYKRESLTLKVPDENEGAIQYVGVWSPTMGMISSVTFPQHTRIPPAKKNLR